MSFMKCVPETLFVPAAVEGLHASDCGRKADKVHGDVIGGAVVLAVLGLLQLADGAHAAIV